MPLTFLISELAFTDEEETHTFLIKYQADQYIDPSPAQAAAIGSANTTKRKRVSIPLKDRLWDAKASQAALQTAKDKLRSVDVSHSSHCVPLSRC